MTADEYNASQLDDRHLLPRHVTQMVRLWQQHHGLDVDGMAGPDTIASIERSAFRLAIPLPTLPDGRKPEITSEFRPSDRPNHNGVDLFYRWRPGDKPDFCGDHGAVAGSDGRPKWVVPVGTLAIAAAAGVVQLAGPSPTGVRVWIDHGNGLRTGYFHLLGTTVVVGQKLQAGDAIGLVGDNPVDHDGRHLHFELSPVDRYDPMDPAPLLA